MAGDSWYQNFSWSVDIANEFERRLARSRNKVQYLRIQASCISRSHPEIALELLGRYIRLPEHFDRAQAYVDRADALDALGRTSEAIRALEEALARETEYPKHLTQAYLLLPQLIVRNNLGVLFPRALTVLQENQGRALFPVDFFRWNAMSALINVECHERARAVLFATRALAAAAQLSSGFGGRPNVGLVGAEDDELKEAMNRIVAA